MNNQTLIQKLRLQKGLSQSELARLSGINYRTLQDFDQGRKSLANAKGEMIYRLSMALECTSDNLLSDSVTLNISDDTKEILQKERLLQKCRI